VGLLLSFGQTKERKIPSTAGDTSKFILDHCHFLCLETKKVTKENSRKKVTLRTFFLARAQAP
jgi:hypothetical protein